MSHSSHPMAESDAPANTPSAGEASRIEAAAACYAQGNEARRRGQWHEAINCYIKAAELDPDSPAVEAKQMLDDIMSFYNRDAYNP